MSRRFGWALALSGTVIASFVGATCSSANDTSSAGTASTESAGAGGAGTGGGSALVGSGGTGGDTLDGSSGDSGKPPTCDPSCKAAGGTCSAGVCTSSDNPGNVDPATIAKLEGGGSADPAFRWLYPYDETVFPRGLLPPTLQFDGAAADALYVHVTMPGLEYKGYYGPSSPVRATMAAPMWTALTLAAKGGDAVKVEVTKIAGGQVTGPVSETWTIAQGSLRGTIYYETYGSQLAGSVGIMKISPGASQPAVLKSGCGNVCHTASADGSTLVAATTLSASASYDLKNNAALIKAQSNQWFTYGGLYPDGSFLISATNYRTWTQNKNGGASRLYDTHTGAQIPSPSWDGAVQKGGTVAFSPDGKWVAFNHEDTGAGHSLAVMAYDPVTKTFSGLTDVANDPASTLAWPAFTPDSKWIVYHAGSSTRFETDANATGDLYVVDVATHATARLDALDGYANGATYLPANDPGLSFAPTVLPEAVGGYYWAVFTSHRSYGNTLPSKDNNDQNGKLWVAAIDLNAKDGKDPSHPAFYLDGQEAVADNLRGFWVLDPCKQDGGDCQSGDECCGGYCRDMDGGMVCSSMQQGCSNEYDKCTVASDCCDAADQCINGHCAAPPPK